MAWEAAERVQKNEAGEFRALIGGDWIPVSKAQKSESGEFRVDRTASAGSPAGERLRHASDSWLTNMPDVPKSVQEFATGATGILRGVANLPGKAIDAVKGPQLSDLIAPDAKKQYAGDVMFPPQGDADSGWKTAGSIADPLAWAIGGGVPAAAAKTLEKLAASGPAALKIAEGLAKHWAGRAAGRAATGAAAGGAIGALSEEGTAGTGAAIGAGANVLIPPVFSGVLSGATAAKNAIYPSPGSLAVKAAGDKADDVITALTNAQSGVPGVNLTAGQASVPANSAEFAALQKLVAGKDPSRYAGPLGVRGQQDAARLAELRTVGQDSTALSAAETARKTASDPLYAAARQGTNPVDTSPVMAKVDLILSKNPGNRELVTELTNIKKGLDAAGSESEKVMSVIDGLKASLDNKDNKFIKGVLNNLKNELSRAVPGYERAQAEFAKRSAPINQMKLGQEIEQALVAPVTGSERAAGFGNAVRKAETKVSSSTGMPRIDDLTPRQQKAIDAIEANLKLDADYKNLASAGKVNLDSRIGTPVVPPTGIFQPMVSAARSWLNRILGTGHEKALEKLAPLMEKNPQAFAQLMKSATPQQRQAVNSMLSEYVTTGAIVGGSQQ